MRATTAVLYNTPPFPTHLPGKKTPVLTIYHMFRVATTYDEVREARQHWERMRRDAAKIRDAYDRGEERRVREQIGGTRGYKDSVVLFYGPPPSS